MSKVFDIGVERDHIEAQTKANGVTALSELIWNSLDADATEIEIESSPSKLGGFEYLKVSDNGHGLTYEKAQDVFSRLGGSEKKMKSQSPGGRAYHGKEGKGRYKSLALGDLVQFKSTYKSDDERYSQFTAIIDRNNLSKTVISDLKLLSKGVGRSGFELMITNVNHKNVLQAVKEENRPEIEEKFASYWISYPKFRISFNGRVLEFRSLIRDGRQQTFSFEKLEQNSYTIKVIEWNFENKRKTFLCNNDGIPFQEINIGLRSSIPISVFIQAEYIEQLHRNNTLDFWESDEFITEAYRRSKIFARDYVRERLHQYSKEFIEGLKAKGIYPYKDQADNFVEQTKRQVFDIVALQLHEYLPSFNDQDDKNKKLTLTLISEALEKDARSLRKILSEIVDLPKDKREDLADLLDITSFPDIIDAMTEIRNRLHFLNGLEQIIYDNKLNKDFLERKHLHKIIINETWVFGEQYCYGVDDISLKNVLKKYLKDCMGREDLEESVEQNDNSDLSVIPDVCLWQQYSLGSAGKENLIIELKKPRVDAGILEKGQIESYASRVSKDPMFPKNKTRWKFILVTRNIKSEIEPLLHQVNRTYGHISQGENFDVYILKWGDIISEAKLRLEFIKEKLNINLQDNQAGIDYLKSKYKEYLPPSVTTQ